MEGSFNQANRQGQSSASPATPSNYQVNINRKKTRKWVEAKTQSYDGDDWGASGDDDDDDDDQSSVERQDTPPILRPGGAQRLPSETRWGGGGNGRFISDDASATRTPSPGSIKQVQQLKQHQDQQQSHIGASEKPLATDTASHAVVTGPGPGQIVSPQPVGPPRGQPATGMMWSSVTGEGRTQSPTTSAAKLVRPSDIYRQMEAEKLSRSQTGESQQLNDAEQSHEADRRMSVSPQLPSMVRMSSFGVDMFSGTFSHGPTATQPTADKNLGSSSEAQIPERPATISPDTETSRTTSSQVGPYFNEDTNETTNRSAQTGSGEITSHVQRPSLPGGWVTESSVVQAEESEKNESTVEPATQTAPDSELRSPLNQHEANIDDFLGVSSSKSSENVEGTRQQLESDLKNLPRLQTSSQAAGGMPPPRVPQVEPVLASLTASRDITPTEPLQPRARNADYSPYTPSGYGSPLLQKTPTYDTHTSSPVKESDVLSAEIMRTLSPGGPHTATSRPQDNWVSLQPRGLEDGEEIKDQDPTENDPSKQKQDVDVLPSSSMPTTSSSSLEFSNQAPVSSLESNQTAIEPIIVQDTIVSPGPTTQKTLRHKFSWEAPDSPEAPSSAQFAEQISPKITASPSTTEPKRTFNGILNENVNAKEESGPVNDAESPEILVVSDAGVSHQVSNASTSEPSGPSLNVLPSPLSDASDKSQREKTVMVTGDGTEEEPSTPTDPKRESPGRMAPEMSTASKPASSMPGFRDIMNLSSPEERLRIFDETRANFATMETGLNNWIASMMKSQPEHSNATSSYSGTQLSGSRPTTHGSSNFGPNSQGQQNPNSGGLGATASSSTRARLAGLQAQAQAAAGSAFGHSGNQVGHKSKELMHSAGKMGKGLLNKGKSKLRGTGDKDDTSPTVSAPSSPHPNTHSRLPSWSLGSLGRSQEEAPSQPVVRIPLSNSNASPVAKLSGPTYISPLMSPNSPFGKGFHLSSSSAQESLQPKSPGRQKPKLTPLDTKNLDKNSASGNEIRRGRDPTPVGHQTVALSPTEDWVMVGNSGDGTSNDDSANGKTSKLLPPIRRTSTFGFTTKPAAKRASERFSMIDDNEENPVKAAEDPNFEIQLPMEIDGGVIPNQTPAEYAYPTYDSNATLIGQDSTVRTTRTSLLLKEPMPWSQPASPVREKLVNSQGQEQGQQQGHTEEGSRLPDPLSSNPVRARPPVGWQLEESQLTEPLHQISRRRGQQSTSNHRFGYGFDKETNYPAEPMSPTSPISSPATGPPTRGKNSLLPPSSAQRYPGLFMQVGSAPIPQGPFPNHIQRISGNYPRRVSMDELMTMGQQVSDNDHIDDRGRKRSGSGGLLQGLGDRIRAVSRERRNSLAGGRSKVNESQEDVRLGNDGTGEATPESRKRRTSFLSGLRPRASSDLSLKHAENTPVRPYSQAAPTQTGKSRVDKSKPTNTQQRPKFEDFSQITGSGNEQIIGPFNAKSPMAGPSGPSKRRLSGFTDLAADLFRRPAHDKVNSTTPMKSPLTLTPRDRSDGQRPTKAAHGVEGRERSATDASYAEMIPPPRLNTASSETRGRRNSMTNMISGLLHRRTESKTRAQVPIPANLSLQNQGRDHDFHHPRLPSGHDFGGQFKPSPSPFAQGSLTSPDNATGSQPPILVRPENGQWLQGPSEVSNFSNWIMSSTSSLVGSNEALDISSKHSDISLPKTAIGGDQTPNNSIKPKSSRSSYDMLAKSTSKGTVPVPFSTPVTHIEIENPSQPAKTGQPTVPRTTENHHITTPKTLAKNSQFGSTSSLSGLSIDKGQLQPKGSPQQIHEPVNASTHYKHDQKNGQTGKRPQNVSVPSKDQSWRPSFDIKDATHGLGNSSIRGQSPGHDSLASDGTRKSGWKGWKNKVSSQLAQVSSHQDAEEEVQKPKKQGWHVRVTSQISQAVSNNRREKTTKDVEPHVEEKSRGAFQKAPKLTEPQAPPVPPKSPQYAPSGHAVQQTPSPQRSQQLRPAVPPSSQPPPQLPSLSVPSPIDEFHLSDLMGEGSISTQAHAEQQTASGSTRHFWQLAAKQSNQPPSQLTQTVKSKAKENPAPISKTNSQTGLTAPPNHHSRQGTPHDQSFSAKTLDMDKTEDAGVFSLPIQTHHDPTKNGTNAASIDDLTPDSPREFILPIQGVDTTRARAQGPVSTILLGENNTSTSQAKTVGPHVSREHNRSISPLHQDVLLKQRSNNSINGMLNGSLNGTTGESDIATNLESNENGNFSGVKTSEDLYNATPRIVTTPGGYNIKGAELEDTAEARLRTMRLSSQEEKIFYDSESDVPKMSATSYPGQEWNPYGESGFPVYD